ncbi:MAG: gamma-glutamyltransferase [Thermoleophilia bacterium]|nr:gamma-glutamyltransferase [Thermoleophilia bacterium]
MAASCAIATPHTLATEAGEEAFNSGGNAIDAAIAAATVLTVVYPHMCAVGGDLWAIVVDPDGKASVVDGCGASAARSSLEKMRETHASMPVYGPETITVPGVVGGWGELIDLGAKLDREALFVSAIRHARHGVPVAPSLARAIIEEADLIGENTGLRALLAPKGRPLDQGDLLVQPNLARSLKHIAVKGERTLYGGELGRAVIDGLATMGSELTIEDFARHEGHVVEPLTLEFRGFDILTSPPPSQGVIFLEILSTINLLEKQCDLDAATLARLFRLSALDRDCFLADPEKSEVPVDRMLSDEHIGELAIASKDLADASSSIHQRRTRAGGDTVAVTAADSEGWTVSLIQSVFHSFGSGVLEPETGILFHNRGAAFSFDSGSPNVYAAEKKPMHTLMPAVAHDGEGVLASMGTMGGLGQPQILTQLMLGLSEGQDATTIVSRPRFTVGGLDVDSERDTIFAEAAIDADGFVSLRQSEIGVEMLEGVSELVGHSQISIFRNGIGEAAADPRSDGSSVVAIRDKEGIDNNG